MLSRQQMHQHLQAHLQPTITKLAYFPWVAELYTELILASMYVKFISVQYVMVSILVCCYQHN